MADLGKRTLIAKRESMTGDLHVVLTQVIGDARLRELLRHANEDSSKLAHLSLAQKALKCGVVSPRTKTALLIAQAAENVAQLADDILSGRYHKGFMSYEHPDFRFLNSREGPEALYRAKVLWMAAQIFHNEARRQFKTDAEEFAKGFKAAASELYHTASGLLEDAKHAEGAELLEALSQNLATPVQLHRKPHNAMESLGDRLWIEEATLVKDVYGPTKYRSTIEALEEYLLHAPGRPAREPNRNAGITLPSLTA